MRGACIVPRGAPPEGAGGAILAGKADYVSAPEMGHVLALLMPANRRAMEVSLATGLRIGDVLTLRRDQLASRMRVTERKTGKQRTVRLPAALLRDLQRLVETYSDDCQWVFPGRDPAKPRTRQAVWQDVQRAARAVRLPASVQCSPHSARKAYAVREFQRTGDLARVQRDLKHSSPEVTLLYAMADELTARKLEAQRDRYTLGQKRNKSAQTVEKPRKAAKSGEKG